MLRKIGLIIAAFVPYYRLRHFYYKLFYNYKIDSNSRIGMFNYINCKELTLVKSKIGFLNIIVIKKLEMSEESVINSKNRIKHLNHVIIKEQGLIHKGNFIGSAKCGEEFMSFSLQNLYLGKTSQILRHNYFDVGRTITIGDNVVFGGEGSEIWTHGFEINRNMLFGEVTFGNDIFIGSKCIFTKNVKISDNVIIGPGSVIFKSIQESGFYSTHQLTKIR